MHDYDRTAKTSAIRGAPDVRIRMSLEAISYLVNGVAAWNDAHAGNVALAKKNGKKVEEAERLLGEVLASMPGAVKYMVYGLEDKGVKAGPYKDADALLAAVGRVGIRLEGYSSSTGRLRPELKGQPEFDNLMGPMYDGPGVARYETWELNERMSR